MPSPLPGFWLAFPSDTPEEAARRRFLEKYGRAPAEVHRRNGLLLIGPVDRGPEADRRPASLLRRAEAAARPLSPERARQLILNLEEVTQ